MQRGQVGTEECGKFSSLRRLLSAKEIFAKMGLRSRVISFYHPDWDVFGWGKGTQSGWVFHPEYKCTPGQFRGSPDSHTNEDCRVCHGVLQMS